ncbi:filamentous haemagglutinin family outer membrane protein [Clostridium sp. CAG:813]|nr:filamentous haemagglutinin family outer membrane protein [Clostridium sp. CAG:813]
MRQSGKNQKRTIAVLLTGLFMVQQTMGLSVFAASTISGVTNGGSGSFNIDPTTKNNGTGFRHYQDFNLGQGDVANLNFADINTFVNMVDNQVVINGIVNSVRGNGFYNGKAVFISPNGMVVGASGVLNVGSLGVYTPNSIDYTNLKNSPSAATLAEATENASNGGAPITINGKVITAGNVDLVGGQIDIAKNAGIVGGVNLNQMTIQTSEQQATALFNNLVNTDNLANGNNFTSDATGQIRITSNKGVNVAGNIINYATGGEYQDANSTNYSGILINSHNGSTPDGDAITSGINVSGNIVNTKGLVEFNNNGGDLDISGNIKNNGTTHIYNQPLAQYSDATKNENIAKNSGINITGKIDTKGNLRIENRGGKGLNISGTVNHEGDSFVQNGYSSENDIMGYGKNNEKLDNTGALNIGGTFNTTGNAEFLNTEYGQDGLNVTGNVTTGGKATYTNKGAAGLNVKQGGAIKSSQGLEMTNYGVGGLNITGSANNTGKATVTNHSGRLTVGGTFTNNGDATFVNNGTELNVSGTVSNENGLLDMTNNGANGFNVTETGKISGNGGLNMTNSEAGTAGMNINGTVTNIGNANVLNKAGALNVGGSFSNNGNATFVNDGTELNVSGTVSNENGLLDMTNNGANGFNVTETGKISGNGGLNMTNSEAGTAGMNINGTVTNIGNANVLNKAGALNVKGSFTNTGDAVFTNDGTNLVVNGTVTNNKGTLKMTNNNGAFNVNGTVRNNGTTTNLTNAGADGLNVAGTVYSNGDLTMTNTGAKGINLASTGRVNGDNNIYINNNSKGGVNVKGLVNGQKDVNITSENGNVVIGDNTENDNYITAGDNININVNNGSILNEGSATKVKTLLKANKNLNMYVTDGTIGTEVQQDGAISGSTGIGPKNQGSRDFSKSINANIGGNVTAKTTKNSTTANNLVINYAAIDSDMNIDSIKADGRVILTVDDSSHANGGAASGTRYNMLDANKTKGNVNVEGTGISLISNGSIGTKDNKVTFVQTDAANNKMDALANENIYLRENSFDAYGRDNETKLNTVSTMIAREGDLDVEFAGDTTIDNITAEGDMKIVTRGQKMHIKNLGHIKDSAVTPEDYFGPRDYGLRDNPNLPNGGYTGEYENEALPNNVVVKALDINHNIRKTEKTLDGGYEAWANSTVKIDNAVLDKGKLDITADEIYANGIHATFNKDGFTKVKDPTTNKVQGTPDGVEGIPTGHAVRPDDVTDTGRGETERNYYYPAGDGDGTFKGEDSNVDPDDGIVDATPLEIPDDNPTPPDPPEPPVPPTPDPEPDPTPNIPDGDGSITYTQRKGEDNIDNIDKRQYMRFNVADTKNPVALEKSSKIDGLLDVSRGGIAVSHHNDLKVGDVVPVHLTYGDLDIKTNVKIVTATTSRAGAMFVDLDQATANKLLYLNILLEDSMNLSFNNLR